MKRQKKPITPEQVHPLWEKLVLLEAKLKRNQKLSRILQPIGIFVFALNLLLATGNFALFLGDTMLGKYFTSLPLLSSLAAGLPRGSWTGMLVFTVIFVFVVPLVICGAVAGAYYLLHRNETEKTSLYGDEAACARALTNQAETVYALRKGISTSSTYLLTGILTAVAAVPILMACWDLVMGDSPAVLELALSLLALLLCLFVLFWIYALMFRIFTLLISLFFVGPSQWKLYELYERADIYWESVDPREHARREARKS